MTRVWSLCRRLILCFSLLLFVLASCTSLLTLIFVSLPPQIAALQRGGDSFPLIGASGKVLGKVRQRTDAQKIETNTSDKGVVLLLLTSKKTLPAESQTQQIFYDDHNWRVRRMLKSYSRLLSLNSGTAKLWQELEASVRVCGPQDQPGHSCPPHTRMLPLPGPWANQTGGPTCTLAHTHTHTVKPSGVLSRAAAGTLEAFFVNSRNKSWTSHLRSRTLFQGASSAHHLCNSVLLWSEEVWASCYAVLYWQQGLGDM